MNTANGQDQCNGDDESARLGVSEGESGGAWHKQDKVIDFNSERSNKNEQSSFRRRREVIGGMLSQLMQDAEAQLAYSKSQISYHEKQVAELQKKIGNLQNLMSALLED